MFHQDYQNQAVLVSHLSSRQMKVAKNLRAWFRVCHTNRSTMRTNIKLQTMGLISRESTKRIQMRNDEVTDKRSAMFRQIDS